MKATAASKTPWILSAAGVVVVAGVAIGYVAWPRGAANASALPPELSVEALKAQSSEPGKMMDTMRDAMRRDDLTDEQRRELGRNMREVWQTTMTARMDEYYSASEEEKNDVLDRHIDEFERFRAEMEKRRAEREKSGEDERDRERGRATFGAQSQEERKARSESRNPDQMARMMGYFSAMRTRMTERGIKPPDGPGFGFGGGRGRGGAGRGGP